MLLTLLILEVLLIQVLNQIHLSLNALQTPVRSFPAAAEQAVQSCLQGRCEGRVQGFKVEAYVQTAERQFFNAQFILCEESFCYQISQVFSESSAILKRDRIFHAITVEATLDS